MKRILAQISAFFLINPFVNNFFNGKIYQGNLKNICVPVLNCWSCPGAATSCPLGAIQFFIGNTARIITFYTLGILFLTVAFTGRAVCGWVCPFGFFQDLLFKIKSKKFKIPSWMKDFKFFFLILFVLILPFLTPANDPWFSKICPAGYFFAALPLIGGDHSFIENISYFFYIKTLIALIVLIASIKFSRPFCQTVCPLGAIFEIFKKFSLWQIEVDKNKCISCNKCFKNCPMDIKIYETKFDCIYCQKCIETCPGNAIKNNYYNPLKKNKLAWFIFSFIFLITGIFLAEPSLIGKVGSFICYSCIGF
ncbi:MAG: 4Fe-4S binding protein [Candidatus Muiribacteriota bacterium]